jgi:tetratricopeptide (TPR) repeat protein
MMTIKTSIKYFLLISFIPFLFIYAGGKEEKIVYGFFDNEGTRPIKMFLIGETISIEKASTIEIDIKKDTSLLEVDTRPDTVTIKLLSNPGVRVGQTLYLLEKHPDHDFYKDGNIVAEIKVLSIYKTSFYGEQVRGEGHLRMIEKNLSVGMPINSQALHEAVVTKKQGDYYVAKNDLSSAIQYYKKAIKLDGDAPEPHAALGKIHEKKGEGFISASYEYNLAWKNREKFNDGEDQLNFLTSYCSFLIKKYKFDSSNSKPSEKDLILSIETSKEILRSTPKNFEGSKCMAEGYFLQYLSLVSINDTSDVKIKIDNRKRIEVLDSNTQEYLDRAIKIKPHDYRIHSLAVYFYMEKLNTIAGANSNSDLTEITNLKEKIESHANSYFTYRPKNLKPDKNYKAIRFALERAKKI